jgi:hypothetical protein
MLFFNQSSFLPIIFLNWLAGIREFRFRKVMCLSAVVVRRGPVLPKAFLSPILLVSLIRLQNKLNLDTNDLHFTSTKSLEVKDYPPPLRK